MNVIEDIIISNLCGILYIKHLSKNNFIDKTLPMVHNKTEVVPKHYLSYLHDKPASITTTQPKGKEREKHCRHSSYKTIIVHPKG